MRVLILFKFQDYGSCKERNDAVEILLHPEQQRYPIPAQDYTNASHSKTKVNNTFSNSLANLLDFLEISTKTSCTKYKEYVRICVTAILFGSFAAYFVIACWLDFKRATDLFIVTIFAVFCLLYWLLKTCFGESIYHYIISPLVNKVESNWPKFKW